MTGGKIRQTYLKMPEELHKQLRHEAAEDDVSPNQCILNLLSEALEARRVSVPTYQRNQHWSRPFIRRYYERIQKENEKK